MLKNQVRYPSAGCIVEVMQGNHAMQAWVLEENSGQLRLFTINRREMKLPANRILPWAGPVYPSALNRQEIYERLVAHKENRDKILTGINLEELWELAQGEMTQADCGWFAELLWPEPDVDQLAALGQAMLDYKSHFKFSPPVFEVYTAEQVEQRLQKKANEERQQATVSAGADFFKKLYEAYRQHKSIDPDALPAGEVAEHLKHILLERIADPDAHDAENMWKLLSKDIASKAGADEPHLPLILASTWGIVPEHYNFWLDRADYDASADWAAPLADTVQQLCAVYKHAAALVARRAGGAGASAGAAALANDAVSNTMVEEALAASGLPSAIYSFWQDTAPVVDTLDLISIDPSSTKDWDDAACLQKSDTGYKLSIALACPAAFWPFASTLDKTVLRRATSLYFPEGNLFMMPEQLCLEVFSLHAGEIKPSLLLDIELDAEAEFISITPRLVWTTTKSNLALEDVEKSLEGEPCEATAPFAGMLKELYELACLLQKKRIEAGAVVTERVDPQLKLISGEGGNTLVHMKAGDALPMSQLIVGEIMVLANYRLARWGTEQYIPLIYRTQNVTIPKDFSGIWNSPEKISKVLKALPPSQIGLEAKRHAGLGVEVYSSFTAPMRRYPDLLNEAQIVYQLITGKPLLDDNALKSTLPLLSARLDVTGQAQRFRPRYWKLLYFQQQDQKNKTSRPFYDAVIAEVNNNFIMFALEGYQFNVRGVRSLLYDAVGGQRVSVRLGKINPLRNEVQVVEVLEN